MKDLLEYSEEKAEKFTARILKKDYERDQRGVHRNLYVYRKEEKEGFVRRSVNLQNAINEEVITYQTSSVAERNLLNDQVSKLGFINYDNRKGPQIFYQKGEFTITMQSEVADSMQVYSYRVARRSLPRARDIIYAEEMLALASHEYIETVFGKGSVIKDVFYFSEKEKSVCSILFPGTEKEVIFIWGEEGNCREIDLMVFGGGLQTTQVNQLLLPHNVWRSRQGVYAGMTLKDLELQNGGPVSFYSWASEMAGTLLPSNSGKIDFKKLGVVLNCLNCNIRSYEKTPVVNSAIETDDRRIYVTTLVLVPEKQKQVTALR